MALRSELRAIADRLLADSASTSEVTLDVIGHAIGARAITAVEIDELLGVLEQAGRTIASPAGGDGEARLKAVVAAARALAGELGRPAKVAEIAARAVLSPGDVRHALTLLKVMQR